MTKTTQPRFLASLSEPGKDLTIDKPETEDNMSLLLSVYDGLNKLTEKLSRLDYVLKRKNIELILKKQNTGEKK